MNSGCRMVAMSEARLTEGRTEHAKTPKATVGVQRTTRGGVRPCARSPGQGLARAGALVRGEPDGAAGTEGVSPAAGTHELAGARNLPDDDEGPLRCVVVHEPHGARVWITRKAWIATPDSSPPPTRPWRSSSRSPSLLPPFDAGSVGHGSPFGCGRPRGDGPAATYSSGDVATSRSSATSGRISTTLRR